MGIYKVKVNKDSLHQEGGRMKGYSRDMHAEGSIRGLGKRAHWGRVRRTDELGMNG